MALALAFMQQQLQRNQQFSQEKAQAQQTQLLLKAYCFLTQTEKKSQIQLDKIDLFFQLETKEYNTKP